MTSLALAHDEQGRLATLEAVVERGLASFVEVGNALMEIRDERLYRETHATFEDYCRERFGLKRPRAYELIQASRVVLEISDTAPPQRESHAAELAPLLDEPEVLRETWAEVRELHPEPTAANRCKLLTHRVPLAAFTASPT